MFNFILSSFKLNVERWKYNSKYEVYVSTVGNFKNKNKENISIKITENGGYCAIKTSHGYKSAHRLVLLTWRPIADDENLTVDHKNHNKRDNSLSNLEWVAEEENLSRADNDLINCTVDAPKVRNIIAIVGGKMIEFKNVSEASTYILNKPEMKGYKKVNRVKNRIESAIENDVKYCGIIWKYK